MVYNRKIIKIKNFNALHLPLVRFLTFSMRITIQAGTRKTATNSLKTIRKNIDGSLKCFAEILGSPIPDTQKDFFQQGPRNILAMENQVTTEVILKYDQLLKRSMKK